MLVLITYDVNTENASGRRRLRKTAKICTNYGRRVQNSGFECELDAAQFVVVKAMRIKVINKETDSLRFYSLGNNYKDKVEYYGAKPSFDVTEPLII